MGVGELLPAADVDSHWFATHARRAVRLVVLVELEPAQRLELRHAEFQRDPRAQIADHACADDVATVLTDDTRRGLDELGVVAGAIDKQGSPSLDEVGEATVPRAALCADPCGEAVVREAVSGHAQVGGCGPR